MFISDIVSILAISMLIPTETGPSEIDAQTYNQINTNTYQHLYGGTLAEATKNI